jgi:hypothetical protein
VTGLGHGPDRALQRPGGAEGQQHRCCRNGVRHRRPGPVAADPTDRQRPVGTAGRRAQEIGEHIAETASPETREQAGVEIDVVDVVGIYTYPNHVVEFSDGEGYAQRPKHYIG